ncbi:checkpoint protein HUS1 [Camelus ferus]|nr:checkpoint protein HUS1 [Camelus ferus]
MADYALKSAGSQGHALIKLAQKITPTAVTMEHISEKVSPSGNISSAPKEFSVYVRSCLNLCSAWVTMGVSTMIAKLAKTCTLRISPDKLNFVLSDKVASGGVSMWCELEQANFFSEFQMEGVSAENNEIYLELTSENLSRALKTAQNARALKVKLTNKHFPCLTVSIELKRRFLSTSTFEVFCTPPASSAVNTSVFGDLCSPVRHSSAMTASGHASQDHDPERMTEVHVDVRKLLQFLAGQQGNPAKATCNIVSNKMVHFDLLHEDVSLQYFIPALS